jgi:hypothetical protein
VPSILADEPHFDAPQGTEDACWLNPPAALPGGFLILALILLSNFDQRRPLLTVVITGECAIRPALRLIRPASATSLSWLPLVSRTFCPWIERAIHQTLPRL